MLFVLSNSNAIYLKSDEGNIKKLLKEPFSENGIPRFALLTKYNNYIYMVPKCEKSMYRYDLTLNVITPIDIEKVHRKDFAYPIFRDALRVDNTLWLLPNNEHFLLRYQLENESYTLIDLSQSGLNFDNINPDFYNISYYDGYVYMFRWGANNNLKISVTDNSINIIDIPIKMKYSLIDDGKIYASAYDKGNIIEYDIYSKKINEIEIDNKVWNINNNYYQYWKVKKIKEYICFLPYSAKAIIFLNPKNGEIRYGTVETNNIINDVVMYEDEIYAISENMSVITVFNKDLSDYYEKNCSIHINELMYNSLNVYLEENKGDFMRFLELNDLKLKSDSWK